MSDPANLYFRVVRRVTESIALYPVLIPALYVVVALLVFAFESTDTAATLRDELPPGLIDADNSREVLGTLITGIISLVVFSFSMVMVVLNGAASRLSPRVLPGLISDRRNQVILGIYLGSIVYYLLLITSIKALHGELRALREEADAKVQNQQDRRTVNEALERLAELERGSLTIAPLPVNGVNQPKAST